MQTHIEQCRTEWRKELTAKIELLRNVDESYVRSIAYRATSKTEYAEWMFNDLTEELQELIQRNESDELLISTVLREVAPTDGIGHPAPYEPLREEITAIVPHSPRNLTAAGLDAKQQKLGHIESLPSTLPTLAALLYLRDDERSSTPWWIDNTLPWEDFDKKYELQLISWASIGFSARYYYEILSPLAPVSQVVIPRLDLLMQPPRKLEDELNDFTSQLEHDDRLHRQFQNLLATCNEHSSVEVASALRKVHRRVSKAR